MKKDTKTKAASPMPIVVGVSLVALLAGVVFFIKDDPINSAGLTTTIAKNQKDIAMVNPEDKIRKNNSKRTVYTGNIEQRADGADKIVTDQYTNIKTYWKKVSIPGIRIDDLAQVTLYVTPEQGLRSGFDSSNDKSAYQQLDKFIIEDGAVWINYGHMPANYNSLKFNFHYYKIVVVQ